MNKTRIIIQIITHIIPSIILIDHQKSSKKAKKSVKKPPMAAILPLKYS